MEANGSPVIHSRRRRKRSTAALLPDPHRVVDVIFGILAQEADRVGYFYEELKVRQLPDKDGQKKVDTVMQSLKTIHNFLPKPADAVKASGHSKTKGIGSGRPTKSLL